MACALRRAAQTLLIGALCAASLQGEARALAAYEQPRAPAGAPVVAPGAPRTGALAGVQAPAPAAGAELATITNVVEAATGTMVNGTHLLLGGVSPNVAWVLQDSSFGGRATGRFPVADFVDSDFAKDGSWLGSPEAVVHATDQASGNDTTLVLLLSGPVYNATAGTLAFNVTPAGAGSAPKLSGGAAASALANAQAVSLRRPAAGLQLSDVSLFIDDSSPPADASGSKSHFAPLGSGQQTNRNRYSPGGNRFAPLDRNSGGGLIHAGSAYYGWFYPFVPRDCWNTAACSAGMRG